MLGNYYYHQIIRKTVISFGTLFNNLYIEHKDGDDDNFSTIKVPISYGPIQKFLARIEQKPDLRERVAITLPRMSFQIGQLTYDASRKSSTLQSFKAIRTDNNKSANVYMPVPYNLPIELTIACKYNDDMLQIIEQIIPYFRPEFNLTVDLVSTIGEKKDIPLVLQSISPFQDNYEGNYQERRFITCTLNFVAKIFFYGPIPSDENGIIKKVTVDYYNGTNIVTSPRVSRYVVTPRAIKDYNDDATTFITQDIDENDIEFEVSNTISLAENSYIMVNDEEMYIQSINGNKLKVLRGQDNSTSSSHYTGDVVNIINQADNELIQPTDDFGFDEEKFDFGDGRF